MVRAELVGKKSKISYIILEQNAILDGVGGKTHIEGIIRALQDCYTLDIVGVGLENLDGLNRYCNKIEVGNVNSLRFYFKIALYILSLEEKTTILYRKTLIGLLVICPLILLMPYLIKSIHML